MITISAETFNRWHNKKRLCRAPDCPNPPKWPKREYCSEECSKKFLDYYLSIHLWETAKSKALNRDNYTCQKCGYRPQMVNGAAGGMWLPDNHNLQVDHKIARSLIYHVHYIQNWLTLHKKEKRKSKNYIKWLIEYEKKCNQDWNLITLCQSCHVKKTNNDIRKLRLLRKITGIKDYYFMPSTWHSKYIWSNLEFEYDYRGEEVMIKYFEILENRVEKRKITIENYF